MSLNNLLGYRVEDDPLNRQNLAASAPGAPMRAFGGVGLGSQGPNGYAPNSNGTPALGSAAAAGMAPAASASYAPNQRTYMGNVAGGLQLSAQAQSGGGGLLGNTPSQPPSLGGLDPRLTWSGGPLGELDADTKIRNASWNRPPAQNYAQSAFSAPTQEAAPDEIEGMPGFGMGPGGMIFKYNPDGTMGNVAYDPAQAQAAAAQQAIGLVNNAGMASSFDMGGLGYQPPPPPPPQADAVPANVANPFAVGTAGPPPLATATGGFQSFAGTPAPVTTASNSNTFNPLGGTTSAIQPVIQPTSGYGYTVTPTNPAQSGNGLGFGAVTGSNTPPVALGGNGTGFAGVTGANAPAGPFVGPVSPINNGTTLTPGVTQQITGIGSPNGGTVRPQLTTGGTTTTTATNSGGTGGTGGTTTTGLPDSVPISWPTNPAANGPQYAGNERRLGDELGALSSYINPLAQQTFNLARELNPGYTQLNAANFNSASNAIGPQMAQTWANTNQALSGFQDQLGGIYNTVTANTPGGAQTAQTNAATSTAVGTPQTNLAQVGGPAMQSVQGTTVSPQTGFNGVQAASGNPGLSAATSQLGSTGPGSIQQLLEQQAMQGLQQGRGLSWEDKRMAEQAAREGWGARGLINSTGAVAEEILNRDAISRQRERERQSFASAVDQTGFGQRTQGFNNALGLSQANLGYANLGLQGQQANLAAQLQGNQLGFQGQVANQGNALQAALANQGMGLNYAQLATGVNQGNAAAQNNMGQFGANLGQANNQFNASSLNQVGLANTAAANNMNQFNQNLALQGNQNTWNNAMGYGQFLQGNAINPFGIAQGLSAGGPDYTTNLLGYGGDLFNTNYNAERAAEINAANVSAGKQASTVGAIGTVGGAVVGSAVLM